MVVACLELCKNCPTVSQSGHFTFPPATYKGSNAASSPAFGVVTIFYLINSGSWTGESHCGFNLHLPLCSFKGYQSVSNLNPASIRWTEWTPLGHKKPAHQNSPDPLNSLYSRFFSSWLGDQKEGRGRGETFKSLTNSKKETVLCFRGSWDKARLNTMAFLMELGQTELGRRTCPRFPLPPVFILNQFSKQGITVSLFDRLP